MEITVELYSTFSKFKDRLTDGKFNIPENGTVFLLASRIGLPMKYVKLVFVNKQQADLQTILSKDDTVHFFPPAIGGG